jgi:5-methylcytosine-specific restriction endonuclease McrA
MDSQFYQTPEWLSLREIVLAYYGRTCMACGCNDSERSMHVDHIVPRSRNRFLQLEFDNMQVLCEFCNIQKGTEIVDYRIHLSPYRRAVTFEKLKLARAMASRWRERSRPVKRMRYVTENVVAALFVEWGQRHQTGSDG